MATPHDAFDYLSRLQDRIDAGLKKPVRENPVQDMMDDYREAALWGASEASRRQFIDVKADPKVCYRKMSKAEWDNCGNNDKFDFKGIFKFNTGNNYRWWVSTSRDKCVLFGNEAATTSTDVIVVFSFSTDLTTVFQPLKAVIRPGVRRHVAQILFRSPKAKVSWRKPYHVAGRAAACPLPSFHSTISI